LNQQSILTGILNAVEQDCQVAVCLSSFPRKADVPAFIRLNITKSLANQFLAVARNNCNPLRVQIAANDLVLQPFNIGSKHTDDHELEWLDFTTLPPISAQVAAVPPIVNAPLFDGNKDFLASLNCYVIIVEPPNDERIIFFRRYSPSKELARSRKFAILRAGGQYDKIADTTFLFDEKLDCFSQGNLMFIRNKRDFQYIFRFFEMLQQAADDSLNKIRQAVPMINFDEFAGSCGHDANKLAKLNSIANQPYLSSVTISAIKQTIQQFGLTGVQIVDDKGVEKLEFDPTDRWAILKLLDDDYLGSVLTNSMYEVNSKRSWTKVP